MVVDKYSLYLSTIFMALLLICFAGPCLADELDELDDLLGGFDTIEHDDNEEDVSPENLENESILASWFSLTGNISLTTSYNFSQQNPETGTPDYRGISMFRVKGELINDLNFGRVKTRIGTRGFFDFSYAMGGDRLKYEDNFLDLYEDELELTEAYVQTTLTDWLDFKVGRQLVVWGKSDNIRITDVLNPVDMRQPGLVDIRDMRLPVTMSKVDLYMGDWNVSTIVIHEPRFNKMPAYNGEFFPGGQPLVAEIVPEWSLENQQYGLALNGMFSGWDLSFYLASIFDANAHIVMIQPGTFEREHERILMAGVATNFVLGSWLLKGEFAYFDGLKFFSIEDEKSRIDALVGFEYNGLIDITFALEVSNRHLLSYDSALESAPNFQSHNQFQYALRYQQNFFNDTIHFTALASLFGTSFEGGGFERCQVEYDINDDFSLTTGVVVYQSGDQMFLSQIGDSDRVFVDLKYRF